MLPADSSQARAPFIVIEGIDGSGSTTQCRRLVEALVSGGQAACHTFQPSQGPIGSLIRSVIERRLLDPQSGLPRPFQWSTLALLFAADRLDHVDNFIAPALLQGQLVVCDRYDLSSLAYQSLTAEGGADVVPWIRQLNCEALRPDLTLVLDVPVALAEARRRQRGGAEELFESRSLQERLAAVYLQAERLVPGDRVRHVSGEGEPEAVTERLLSAVMASFPGLSLATCLP
ncbi:MAG TPA: dTMP kinase [Polyangiaceae bacterium]|nr:dTMP kinase [Polyangiaceae bacterium]